VGLKKKVDKKLVCNATPVGGERNTGIVVLGGTNLENLGRGKSQKTLGCQTKRQKGRAGKAY